MGYMDNSIINTGNEMFLGKYDIMLAYNSKWPIYKLSVFKKNGLWKKFKNKLIELDEKNLLNDMFPHELYDYYIKNPEVEFEVHVFSEIMQKHHLFKIENIAYSYSWGVKTKNTKNIAYVRFYFDLNLFFNY